MTVSDSQQRASGWTRTWGHCREDKASVHGTPVLPTKLMDALIRSLLSNSTTPNILYIFNFVMSTQTVTDLSKITRGIRFLTVSAEATTFSDMQ